MEQQSTKDRILVQSVELFSEYGYDAVSMRQIADAVGIKGGSIYNHFDSKSEIMDAIVDFHAQLLQKYAYTAWRRLANLHPSLTIREFLELSFFDIEPEDLIVYLRIFRIQFQEQYHNEKFSSAWLQSLQTTISELTRVLRHMVFYGTIPPCDCVGMANIIYRTLFSIGLEACMDFTRLDELADLKQRFIVFAEELLSRGVRGADTVV